MVIIETPTGWRHFTKAVFVWTGHVVSGWPTKFDRFVYNDPFNGLITYGHDDTGPNVYTWFIPAGCIALGEQTVESPSDALRQFKLRYGDRIIVWVNNKEGMPMMNDWAQSDYVLRCEDLKLPAFTGATQQEFKEWADVQLDLIRSDQHFTIPRMV